MIRVVLQERDRRILEAVSKLRFITREHAADVGPFSSVCRTNARLLGLVRSGHLRRFFVGEGTGRKAVYTTPGEAYEGKAKTTLFLAHHLAINCVLLSARHGPNGGDTGYAVASWKKHNLSVDLGTRLIPDGSLLLKSKTTDQFVTRILLEIDLGTETLATWAKKVAQYLALRARMQAVPGTEQTRLRVAVIASSANRLSNLRKVTAQQVQGPFRFTLFDRIKQRGFWSPIWHRASGDQEESLI